MPEAVIVGAGRTPIGRAYKGSLTDVRPDDLIAHAMKSVVNAVGIDPAEIDDAYIGCGMPHGEQGFNVARLAVLRAGFPESVPAATVNRFCASSLQAIRMAYHGVLAGEGDMFLAGGVESISRVDQLPGGFDTLNPYFLGENSPWNVYISMLETADNVAERYNVDRDEMDRFAQQSQMRAVSSQADGFFEREIIPVTKPDGTVVTTDDGPRASSTLEKLRELKPVREGGWVTPGNACPLNDGAAATIICSADKAKSAGLKPMVRIVACAASGLEPEYMGVGPIEAVKKVLKIANMTIDDIDVVELNEAFAAQVLPVCKEIGVDPFSDKLNPHGGAIALGHPYGMTGARIMTTLINDLQTLDRSVGLETMCVGGGQGMAMIVERVN